MANDYDGWVEPPYPHWSYASPRLTVAVGEDGYLGVLLVWFPASILHGHFVRYKAGLDGLSLVRSCRAFLMVL